MKTSIIIPLGTGSRWNNLELRYCLRSIEKHLIGYDDVFIVGDHPDWLRNVIHIPCYDQGDKTYDKERNIYTKIMAAIADERVTDDFLFMNDDHFLLQGYEAGKFPYYYDSTLNCYLTVTDYKHSVKNTLEWANGALVGNFDVHAPIIYNKLDFTFYMPNADWTKRFGYCIKSMYCDIKGIIGVRYPDLKINEALPASNIHSLLTGRAWFSIGDKAFNGGIRQVLQDLYPHKSRYE